MPTTPKGFPYPAPSDTPDVPRDIKALADKIDALLPKIAGGIVSVTADASGRATIPHGLGVVPRSVVAIPAVATTGTAAVVAVGNYSTPDATNIYVRMLTPAGIGFVGGITIHWQALA